MPDPSARTETLHSSPRAREAAGLDAGQRLGRFVIERTIGAGGMGTVFAARDPDLDRLVAIKVLHAGTGDRARQQRLLQEARAIARIRHPNVVIVHEIGEHEQRLFVVMELIEGPSLREWLASARFEPLPRWSFTLGAGCGLPWSRVRELDGSESSTLGVTSPDFRAVALGRYTLPSAL